DAGDMRLVVTEAGRIEPTIDVEPVGLAAAFEVVETRHLLRLRGDDDLAATIERDPMLGAEAGHRLAPLGAEPGTGRAGFVVETGMEDAAVVAGLMGGDAVLR